MEFENFKQILNKQIFDKSKRSLLENIAKHPERFTGLFRPAKPNSNIILHLLQSNNIKFGNAIEKIFEQYFIEAGYTIIDGRITFNDTYIDIDLLVIKDKTIIMIEQKVRDDHDSTKRKANLIAFTEKIDAIQNKYKDHQFKCLLYFVDPSFTRNKSFYKPQIEQIESDYQVYTRVLYGSELWSDMGYPDIWIEMNSFLKQWQTTLPDIPSVNLDLDYENTFDEIKDITPTIYRSLLTNSLIVSELLPILFSENKTLNLLLEHFKKKELPIYQSLATKLCQYINIL